MNKTAKKRAFFVVAAMCLVYISVAVRVTDFFSMKRTLSDHRASTSPMNIYPGGLSEKEQSSATDQRIGEEGFDGSASAAGASVGEIPPDFTPVLARPTERGQGEIPQTRENRNSQDAGEFSGASDSLSVEPSLLLAVPVICMALKEGRIDREGLIFSKKDAYNSGNWKKPLDILRDRDEGGIKILLQGMGKDFLLEVLKKEGIDIGPDVTAEQLMSGKGYTVDKKKLLSLYRRHVAEGYNDLFPFMLAKVGVIKTKAGFELVEPPRTVKPVAKEEEEWIMPNLANLPIRTALEKLTVHTSRIRVYGSGVVVEQNPRPFERLRGESECSIQGRLYSQ